MCVCLYGCDDMLSSTFMLDEWCILVILRRLTMTGDNSEELIICFYELSLLSPKLQQIPQ